MSAKQVLALVDCNNFYISCERLFRGELQQRPVVVLGNNDGAVIARSNEAKALGVTMSMPYFQCKPLIDQHRIEVFSANYPLYHNLSRRVLRVLSRFTPRLEEYSIDEAFLDLAHVPAEHVTTYGQQIRSTILQQVGIPVSVGIAPTKVLTKVACEHVKRTHRHPGVCNLMSWSVSQIDDLLAYLSAEEVWGIGRASARVLGRHGIISARTLKYSDHIWVRHLLNVAAQRAVLELQGVSCLPLQTRPKPRSHLLCSLSFGRPVEQLGELEEAVAYYTTRVAETLRKQGTQAGRVGIFIHTNPFDRKAPQYARGEEVAIRFPTAYTPELISIAHVLLQHLYRPGFRYKKAGVLLSEMQSQHVTQPDLFDEFSWEACDRKYWLMQSIDHLNERFGRDTLFWGAQGFGRAWFMQQTRHSPHYTTRWQDILPVS